MNAGDGWTRSSHRRSGQLLFSVNNEALELLFIARFLIYAFDVGVVMKGKMGTLRVQAEVYRKHKDEEILFRNLGYSASRDLQID